MKAIQLEQFGLAHLIAKEIPKPNPKIGEVLVRIKAVSLNYPDLIMANGTFNKNLAFPYTPASDGSGQVEAIGEEVTRRRNL